MSHQPLTTRVENALAAITEQGKRVTFVATAKVSGISRSTLYRNPDLRALIQDYRHRHSPNQPIHELITEIGQLRTSVEAIADRLRKQEERLRHLERVNVTTTK